jgi:phosphatidate cytidylyltransferase
MAGAEVARSDVGQRVFVGVALAGTAAVALGLGGIVFWGFISAIALIVLVEWGGLVGADRFRLALAVLLLAITLGFASPVLWGTERSSVALLVILALIQAVTFGTGRLSTGIVVVGLPAIGILHLRAQPDGLALALWTLTIVILTDTGAFFVGRALGGPKLAPRFSPKKTWSGLIGGMIAAAISGAIIGKLGGLSPATLWLGAPLAVLAQAGDLFESWLKRRAGVKDSGRLLPGHGGFLDRVDGAIPVVAVVAGLVAGGIL